MLYVAVEEGRPQHNVGYLKQSLPHIQYGFCTILMPIYQTSVVLYINILNNAYNANIVLFSTTFQVPEVLACLIFGLKIYSR